MLDAGAGLGFRGVRLRGPLRHGPPARLAAVDAADPPHALEPSLVGLAAVGGVGPDVRRGVVVGDDVAEHASVEPGGIGDLALTDEAERPADRDAALVAEAGDGDVDLRLAVGGRLRP